MFYLETKDGDRFFTQVNSDDRAEFEKILEQKLGEQAVQLLNDIICEAEANAEDEARDEAESDARDKFTDDILPISGKLNDVITGLELMLEDETLDKADLEAHISELKSINDELDTL